MSGIPIPRLRLRWLQRSKVGALAGALIVATACSEMPVAPELELELTLNETCIICEDGNGNQYHNPLVNDHFYGSHSWKGGNSTDPDVNHHQEITFQYDSSAYTENSRDWTNPDIEAVSF